MKSEKIEMSSTLHITALIWSFVDKFGHKGLRCDPNLFFYKCHITKKKKKLSMYFDYNVCKPFFFVVIEFIYL